VNSPLAQTELVMLQFTEADMPGLRQELESTSDPLAGALSRCRVAFMPLLRPTGRRRRGD
jgi:hypothetical protein